MIYRDLTWRGMRAFRLDISHGPAALPELEGPPSVGLTVMPELREYAQRSKLNSQNVRLATAVAEQVRESLEQQVVLEWRERVSELASDFEKDAAGLLEEFKGGLS